MQRKDMGEDSYSPDHDVDDVAEESLEDDDGLDISEDYYYEENEEDESDDVDDEDVDVEDVESDEVDGVFDDNSNEERDEDGDRSDDDSVTESAEDDYSHTDRNESTVTRPGLINIQAVRDAIVSENTQRSYIGYIFFFIIWLFDNHVDCLTEFAMGFMLEYCVGQIT